MKFKDLEVGDKFTIEGLGIFQKDYEHLIYQGNKQGIDIGAVKANSTCLEGDDVGGLGYCPTDQEVKHIVFTGVHRMED